MFARRLVLVSSTILLLSAPAGCLLPIPHVKKTCGTVGGTVLDTQTMGPVQGANVEIYYPDGGHRETLTDDAGRFRFGSKYRFHWGYLIGVALNYSLPYDCGWWDFSVLTIDAPGYDSICVLGPSPGGVAMKRAYPEWLDGYRASESEAVHKGRDWAYPAVYLAPAECPP